MLKISKILFPTDFSKCAEQAYSHAIYIAKKYKAELHILNVDSLLENNPQFTSRLSELSDIKKMNEGIINSNIERLIEDADTDSLNIIKITQRGISASPTILEYAHTSNIDLIVMGTHGRRGLGHLFLGSVAEEVVRLAKIPVLTIREEKEPSNISQINNILVPIDFSERSDISLQYAQEIAKLYNSKLQLLHVLEDKIPAAYSLAGIMSVYDLDPDIENKIEKRLENTFNEMGEDEVEHENFIIKGNAAKEILSFAKTNKTDLIVIGSHGLTGIEHLMIGSVAEKVVRMAHCPVFTTKPFGKNLLK